MDRGNIPATIEVYKTDAHLHLSLQYVILSLLFSQFISMLWNVWKSDFVRTTELGAALRVQIILIRACELSNAVAFHIVAPHTPESLSLGHYSPLQKLGPGSR